MFGKIIPLPYKLAAIIIVVVVIFGFGFLKGSTSEIRKQEKARIALQEEIFDLSDDLSVKNTEILKLNQDKKDLIYELEQEALDAKGSSGPGIATTGGLQRLERRWSKAR